MITKADKGNCTVIIDKDKYEEKIFKLLNDKDTYVVLKNDLTRNIERKQNKFNFELYEIVVVVSSSFRRRLRRRRRLKGIHSRSDTNRTGSEGLSFYYPRLLHCLDQMLAVMSLSQHRVSSSKTVRPRAPCGARCIGHAVSTWSAVCSEAPHSQFGEGARPHLCMDEMESPTPVRRRLSLTQAARGKPIPTGIWHWSRAQKHGAWKHFYSTPRSICDLSIQRRGCQVWQGCPKDSAHLAQTCVWILVSLCQYLRTHLKDHAIYDRGPEIHSKPRRVSLPFGEAQLAGCLRVQVSGPLEWDAGIQ